MIAAEFKSENSFCFRIDASIFNEKVLTKVLYWYSDSYIIYWSRLNENIHEITLVLKRDGNRHYSFECITNKLNQDLIDYKNRDIILNETKDIRNILYVKAFSNNDDFEDYNLGLE